MIRSNQPKPMSTSDKDAVAIHPFEQKNIGKTKNKERELTNSEIVRNYNYNYKTNYFWFAWLGPIGMLILKFGWKIKIEGIENVPKKKNYIIMPNHTSHFDAPLAVLAIWPRKALNIIADAKLYKNKYFRILAKMFNAFPVEKNAKRTDIINYAVKRLQKGDNMLWFPEGQRHKQPWSNKCNPGKLGSGMVAHSVDAAVIPVFIAGSEFAMPVGKKLTWGKGPRSIKCLVRFGKEVPLDDLRALPSSRETSQKIVDRIMEHIEALRPSGPYPDQSHR